MIGMTLLAFILGFAALGLFIAAISNIAKGSFGAAILFGVVAVFIGGGAGAIAAYA
jgi:hypothetical protein